MRVVLILGMVIILAACNLITGTETRAGMCGKDLCEYNINVDCFDGRIPPFIPNVDVYVDGKYIGKTGQNGSPVVVTTTEGYHDVYLIKNGCSASHKNVLFQYNQVQVDFCKCA